MSTFPLANRVFVPRHRTDVIIKRLLQYRFFVPVKPTITNSSLVVFGLLCSKVGVRSANAIAGNRWLGFMCSQKLIIIKVRSTVLPIT